MAEIVWADPAIQDLDAIADYIALDKPDAAYGFVQKALAAVERLRRFPQMGGPIPEIPALPYRQLIIPPSRIFYRLEKKVVYIAHVLRVEQLVRRELFAPATDVARKRPPKRRGG